MPLRRDTLVLLALTLVAVATSLAAVALGRSNAMEAFAFVTGAACVLLTVKQSSWNCPLGMVNNVAFLVVFARAALYADAGLQVVYFVLGAAGWWMWLFGGRGRTPLRVSRVPAVEALVRLFTA